MTETRLHATSVAIGGFAVLLIGPSGAGKSDLGLRLMDRGADLISDDYTLLRNREGTLFASPPPAIAGKIEVRGLGIITRPYVVDVATALVVHLARPVERIPLRDTWMTIAGVDVPEVALSSFEHSTAIKVELALQRAATRL